MPRTSDELVRGNHPTIGETMESPVASEILPNNPTNLSHHAAMAVASAVPSALFCGFNVITQSGRQRKQPMSLIGPGVGAETMPEHLADFEELHCSTSPPSNSQFWGVVMQKRQYIKTIDGKDYALVILDLDTKNSPTARDIRIDRLLQIATNKNLMIERSHSRKGGHVIFLAPANELAPKKIDLSNHQEIEIFGLIGSAGKSVMLTGDNLRGQILPISSLKELLNEAGITDDVIFPPAPSKQPTAQIPNPINPSNELEKAQAALMYIDPDIDYDRWIEIGQALHSAFGATGKDLWLSWSSAGSKFNGEKDIDVHWKSFHQNKGVNIGTLFHVAKEYGYTTPTPKSERKSAIEDFNLKVAQNAQQTQPTSNGVTNSDKQRLWREVELDLTKIKPIDYLIDGFLAHSLMVLAGQPGTGKTTAMLGLCMVVAGLNPQDCDLSTECPRKVIYVTEDVSQVQLSLYSYAKHHQIDHQKITDMIRVIEAKRSELPDILMLADNINQHTSNGVRPYLVLDTASACFDIEDENNNSEVAIYMEGIKQTLYSQMHTPTTIVTHTNKMISKSDDAAKARGASAWTGNATLTAVLFMDEEENRFMRLDKRRYSPPILELHFNTVIHNEVTVSKYGSLQDVVCVTVTPQESSKQERMKNTETKKSEAAAQRAMDKSDQACAYVQSVINEHPEGVIIRKGSNVPKPTEDLSGCFVLDWADIYDNVPGANKGEIRRSVGAAIFQRFAPMAANNSWVKLG